MLKKSSNKNNAKNISENPANRPKINRPQSGIHARNNSQKNIQKNTQKSDPKNVSKNNSKMPLKSAKKLPLKTIGKTTQKSTQNNAPNRLQMPAHPIQNPPRKSAQKIAKKRVQNTARNPVKNTAKKPAEKAAQKPIQKPAPKTSAPFNKKADRELSRVMKEKTPVKRKRGYRGGNYILYYLLALIVIVVVLVILSNTVLFRCTEIEVKGNVSYTPEQIVAGSALKTGDNLLHIDTASAEKRVVEACLFVDEAEVRRSFPTKIVITVKEAEACLSVSENGISAAVSRGRKIIKHIDSGSGSESLIVLKGFEPESLELGTWLASVNATKTELPWEMLEIMEQAGLTKITEIDITDRYSPKVTVDNRILLNLGSATQLESKFAIAKTLIDTQVAENENVIISLSNPEQPAIRPNYGSLPQTPSDSVPENGNNADNEENPENEGDNENRTENSSL